MQQSLKLSLFKAPKDEERRLLWERNLHRLDKPLDADCAVCELHFEPHFIVRDYVHVIDGVEVRIPRGTPMLAPDAVRTILPNLPAYLTLKTPAPRTQTKRRHQGVPAENDNRKRRRISTPAQVLVDTNCATSAGSDEADKASSSPSSEAVVTLDDLRGLDLPSKSWALHEFPGFDGVSYVACSLNSSTRELSIERAVFFSSANNGSVECEAFVQDKLISKSSLVMVQEASDALQLVASVPLCCGAAETSVLPPSDLTHGLHAQMKLRGEIFYSVKCMGKSGKEGECMT